MTVSGSNVFVTGASRGLGAVFVDHVLAQGASTVYAGARHPFTHPDPRVVPLRLDVFDKTSIRAVTQRVSDTDILIDNARVGGPGLLRGGTLDLVRTGAIADFPASALTWVAPILARRGGGIAAVVLDQPSLVVDEETGGLCLSEAAGPMFTTALRHALHADGTRVVAVGIRYLSHDPATARPPAIETGAVVDEVLRFIETTDGRR